jgi:glucosamine-6-phosphate deaminase
VSPDPLAIAPDALGRGTRVGLTVVPDAAALTRAFAAMLLDEFQAAKAAGRERPVFIVPVGPVGQYDMLATHCAADGISLADLTLIGMDEYLTPAGDWIAEDDPRSFRGHMRRHLTELMEPTRAPRIVFPHPERCAEIGALIAGAGGVDVAFGGVGIAGHMAFNEPPEPGETMGADTFAALPTRIIRLARETRTINAVTVARGAIDLVPERAVTVGMREILGARKLRLFLNRPWQCGILRKLLHGPVTPAVPASFAQRHPNAALVVTEEVTRSPMPVLA